MLGPFSVTEVVVKVLTCKQTTSSRNLLASKLRRFGKMSFQVNNLKG
jgi:hypothetical protein